ncbi:hypothetical protein [Spirosoma jeollabukense]
MNTTPAYLVCHNHSTAPITRTFFTHENLLTARKAAFTFVESLFAARLEEYLHHDKTEVYLVEITEPNDPTPTIIARLLYKPGHEISVEQERRASKEKLLDLQREFTYYQTHTHAIGFGAFGFSVSLDHEPTPISHITILYEAMASAMVALALYGSPQDTSFSFDYWQPDDRIRLVPIPC